VPGGEPRYSPNWKSMALKQFELHSPVECVDLSAGVSNRGFLPGRWFAKWDTGNEAGICVFGK
jgi:hypothetical protein